MMDLCLSQPALCRTTLQKLEKTVPHQKTYDSGYTEPGLANDIRHDSCGRDCHNLWCKFTLTLLAAC